MDPVFPTAADGDHSYSQESQPKSNPGRKLMAPLQSMDLEVQQVMGEGVWQRMARWTSGTPRLAGGGLCGPPAVLGVAVRMCVEMFSDPSHGCRGNRTVRTLCAASAWTRYGTSRRPSGSSASCPTALMPTAWAACAPGGRADRSSHWMSSSQCHGEASREG